jgi:hypothetical protein
MRTPDNDNEIVCPVDDPDCLSRDDESHDACEAPDDDEPRVAVLGKDFTWEICGGCRGAGMRVHPALSVWTSDDRAEDPDGFEDMLEGRYDVSCDECGGSGKVKELVDTHECDPDDLCDVCTAARNAEWDRQDRKTMAMEQGHWPC